MLCGTTGPPSGSSPARIHTVRGGETLWRISRKYDTSVAAIARANGEEGRRFPFRIVAGPGASGQTPRS